MVHIKNFELFINENFPNSSSLTGVSSGLRQRNEDKVEIIQKSSMDPSLAKKLLAAAVQQYGDNYYQFYTVGMNGKYFNFNTMTALEVMVGSKEGGDYGLNVRGDGTIEMFYGPDDQVGGKLNQDKLSAAMQEYTAAYKEAETLWKKGGKKSADYY